MNIPTTPHFAIVIEDIQYVYHEADERSKSCPGHGYPAHTETIESIKYESYTDEDKWKDRIAVLALSDKKQKFRALRVTPATLKTVVQVDVT